MRDGPAVRRRKPRGAASRAIGRIIVIVIVTPAFVSLCCICIAFVPMFALSGIAGYLFRPLAEAVIFALIASYVLTYTLVPTLANRLLRRSAPSGKAEDGDPAAHPSRNPLVRFQHGFEHRFEAVRQHYRGLLHLALENRLKLIAGFLTVDAVPGADYGKFTLLEFPAGQSVESPSQIQNDIESDNTISKELTLQRGGNSKVVLGNLLTIPLAGKVLYVEPVYTQAVGGNSFPILRHVIAVYGNGTPAFKPTLSAALSEAIGVHVTS